MTLYKEQIAYSYNKYEHELQNSKKVLTFLLGLKIILN